LRLLFIGSPSALLYSISIDGDVDPPDRGVFASEEWHLGLLSLLKPPSDARVLNLARIHSAKSTSMNTQHLPGLSPGTFPAFAIRDNVIG
jgi:hypothetical protein